MKKEVFTVLLILLVISSVSGIVYYFVNSSDIEILKLFYIAVFYMPTPAYSLAIYSFIKKENLILKYLKKINFSLKNVSFTVLSFIIWIVMTLLLTVLLNLFFPNLIADFATSNDQVIENIKNIAGEVATENVNLPSSPILFIPVGIISAIISGFSINLVFSIGEELMWRGYLWDKFKHYSDIKLSLFTGLLWGAWHFPLIVQGYNYGINNALAGSAMFVLFCIAFSFIFTKLMRETNSTILAGSLHGMFNAFAGIFILILVNPNPFIDGAIGVISVVSMILAALFLYPVSRFGFFKER